MLRRAGSFLLIIAITCLLLEGVLRAAPSLIPADALRIFNPVVRSQIAKRVGLLSTLNVEYLPRDDGGPPHRLWRFTPGAKVFGHTMDDTGFCNLPPAAYAEHRSFDLITVGDSFTYCWMVPPESTWTALTGETVGVSVFDLGIPDMGVHEYVQFLKQFALSKHPGVVALCVYEGNDLGDAIKVQGYRASFGHASLQGPGESEEVQPSMARRTFYALMNSPPAEWSYAFNLGLALIGLGVQQLTEKHADSENNFRYSIQLNGRTVAMNSVNAHADDLARARDLVKGQVGLTVFDDAIREFVRLGVETGFVPLLIYMPSAHTAYGACTVFQDPGAKEALDRAHEEQLAYFRRMAEALHYRLVDLTDSMREATSGCREPRLLYLPNDLHLTTFGHSVVANRLASELRDAGLVPRR